MTTPRTTADRCLLPATVIPSHYALQLTPDLRSFDFEGVVAIDVTVTSAEVSSVTLHCHEISISKATFTAASTLNESAVLNTVSISYDLDLTTVTFRFSSALPPGAGRLHIEYKGILNDQMAGFYRSKYADVDGNDQYMASTQFEALDARRAFPCWDEPAVKATFSVTLTVPQQLHALSNMPELSSTHLSNGRKRVVFDVTPVMSTYLLAFAVGVWDVISDKTKNGVAVSVFSPPGRGEQGRFALDVATKCLDFYDNFFQVPYPLPKLDMKFAAGAMENWGLVTYRESCLLMENSSSAEVSHKQRVAMVVCHELAHQWFGNLVTMRWWCDLWLNEGFAAFMQHFATDFIFPEWKIWEQYTIDIIGVALKLDSLRSSHPVMVPIYYAKEVEQVFDAISYNKGSTIVRMAQSVLGTDKFRKGLQLYCRRHAYGNTETSDLWQAWSDVSGIDMAALMESWTQQLGYPCLTVEEETWAESGVSLKLKQEWFVNDGAALSEDEAALCWRIPLLIASSADASVTGGTGGEGGVMNAANIFSTTSFDRVIALPSSPGGGGGWVKLNANQSTLLRVSHSAEMISRLTAAIHRGEVSAIDRAALVDDQFYLGMTGRAPIELFVNCLRAFRRESNTTVWKALASPLTQLLSALESVSSSSDAPIVVAYKGFAKSLVLAAFDLVGWDAKEGEDDRFKLMRSTIFSLVEAFCASEPSILAEARRRFALSLSATTPQESAAHLSSDIKGSVFRIVLSNGSEVEYAQIMKTYTDTSEDAMRKWALSTLGSAPTRALKVQVMEWALSGDVKLQDLYQPMMSVAGSGAEGRDVAWSFFQEHFSRIHAKVAKSNIWSMTAIIVACSSRFCTHARADEVEVFFQNHPVAGADKRIAQIVERTRATAGLSEQVKQSTLMTPEFWVPFNQLE